MAALHLRLFGDFCVSDSDGANLTPKSKKAIGLLALLATSDTLVRRRRWLEDKLWSDRAPEQARGSLRTTLVDIRRALGEASDVLGSDRSSVWLKADTVTTDLTSPGTDREFLEGLDIADLEFNDWLLQQRVAKAAAPAQGRLPTSFAGRLAIQCGTPWSNPSAESVNAQIVNDQIGKIISDFVAMSRCTVNDTNADLVIRTTIHDQDAAATIFVQVIDPAKDVIIHSDHCFTEDLSAFLRNQEHLGRFCWNLADLALEKLHLPDVSAGAMSVRSSFVQTALRHVLSFDGGQMRESLSVLDTATEHLDAGLFLAFKAWAITSMIMEGFEDEDAATLAEIKMLLAKATEQSPSDGMVAAICANVKSVLLEDHEAALGLARRALRENPNNLFALQAMSTSQVAAGQLDLAYDLSKHGMIISAFSKFEAMCNLHHALLCMSMKRTNEATKSSKVAAALAPHYRAPRRQLIGLHAAQNRSDAAQTAMQDLVRLESDFQIDRYLFDRRYPSNTLRKSGYLKEASRKLSM